MAQVGSVGDPSALARDGIFDMIAGDDQTAVQRSITALRRGPIRHRRDQLIVCEGDQADYIFLVLGGVVRSCRTLQNGARNILGFYLPGELFGWASQKHTLSVEAATDAMILYHKRSALLSVAARDSRMANFLLAETTNELLRAQEHAFSTCPGDWEKQSISNFPCRIRTSPITWA